MRSYDKLFIDGSWIEPSTSSVLDVISPLTEEPIAHAPEAKAADADRAVAAARRAFDHGEWPRLTVEERIAYVARLLKLYEAHSDELADTLTQSMGAPTAFAKPGLVQISAAIIKYYLELAGKFTFAETRPAINGSTLVLTEPVGVVAAILPWNTPQTCIATKVAPALLAGCTVIIKPAEETPTDTLLFAELVDKAGFPPGVVNVLPAGREVGEHLVKHPGVDKVTFTGSTVVGRRIASVCGDRLARYTMELGGKSAAIVLDDADLNHTLGALKMASFVNNGQACVAQTRILAPRSSYGEVVDGLADIARSLPIGDPMDTSTGIGPLFTRRHRDRVEEYISIGRQEGARVVAGGGRPPSQPRGWFIEPTIFADVDNAMRIAQEEIFGPVLVVIPYETEADAVRIANDSPYGLAGSVWTEDSHRGIEIAKRVRTGTYGVNTYSLDPGSPFGGYKQSGVGRELGPEGFVPFLEYKSIALPPN